MADDEKLIGASYMAEIIACSKKNVQEYRSTPNYPNKIISESILSAVSCPIKQGLDKVAVFPSKIHGLGVFATENIKKDEIITYYPAHYLLYFPEGRKTDGTSQKFINVNSDLVHDSSLSFLDIKESFGDYIAEINSHYAILGDPRILDNQEFLGHMINDGACGHHKIGKYNRKDNEVYNIVSSKKMNARLEQSYDGFLRTRVIALRDIAEGEEIFVMYGYHYWMARENKSPTIPYVP